MDTVLLPYYTNTFLPSLLHPNADSRYQDFSYTYQLALDSPTLMNAASACASMILAVSHGSQSGQEQAMRFYSKAVSTMRGGLESGEFDGSEDWLLGAVIALCLFEVRRSSLDCYLGPVYFVIICMLHVLILIPAARIVVLTRFLEWPVHTLPQ